MSGVKLIDAIVVSDEVTPLENEYWDIVKQIKLSSDISPINLAQERTIFFEKREKGESYNPILRYRPRIIDDNFKKLNILRDKFSNIDGYLAQQYIALIDHDIQHIIHFSKREDEDFSSWLISLYGEPTPEIIAYADYILNTTAIQPVEEYNISTEAAAELLNDGLKKNNIEGWQICIEDIAALVKVSPLECKITIREGAFFGENQMQRLIVHEIGTHVMRFVEGSKKESLLCKYGFYKYLEAEEGLALYNEKINNLLSSRDIIKYACRVKAAKMTKNHSLSEIVDYLLSYLSLQESFDVALRVKRGLVDTSQPGGYTKDMLYLSGLYKMERLTEPQRMWLKQGKLGFNELTLF